MAMISFQEAAQRLGTSIQVIEEWVRMGLLQVSHHSGTTELAARPDGASTLPQWVDDTDLEEISEAEGWLRLTADQGAGDAE